MTRDDLRRLLEALLDANARARDALPVQFPESGREVRDRLLAGLDAAEARIHQAFADYAALRERLGHGPPADPAGSLAEITDREVRRLAEAERAADRAWFAAEMGRRFGWRYGCAECGREWWTDAADPRCPHCGPVLRVFRHPSSDAPGEPGAAPDRG